MFKEHKSLSNAISSALRYLHPKYLGHDLDLSRSRDDIGHVINQFAICHFLLVLHWNHFRDIQPKARACTHTNTHQVILYSVPCNVLHTKIIHIGIQTLKIGPCDLNLYGQPLHSIASSQK